MSRNAQIQTSLLSYRLNSIFKGSSNILISFPTQWLESNETEAMLGKTSYLYLLCSTKKTH
jgi:hypothetical protein